MSVETKPRESSVRRARWALVMVTVVMGVALVASAVTNFLFAHRHSKMISRASGASIVRAVSVELWRVGPSVDARSAEVQEILEWLLLDLSEKYGLRYLALVDRAGTPVAEAGERVDLPLDLNHPPMSGSGAIEPVPVGSRLRLIVRAFHHGPPPGGGHFLGRPGGPRERRPFLRGRRLVIEFEPVTARQIAGSAFRNLIVSLAAAAILLIASVIAWRLSNRAARVEAQLERDRQLKVLGQMSAVLGHELRNPLASLKGHAQLILEKLAADDPLRPGAETVVGEASRLEELTEQVLDFARTGEVERAPTDVAKLLRAASERSGAAPVLLETPAEIPDWPVDRARLEQVLQNLLVNARQNSPSDHPIMLRAELGPRDLIVEVRDRGEGLEAGDEERVFEPFYTKRVRGTGLGLALSRRIVEGHGGTISAFNHPEGGAVFRVVLPR